MSLFCLNDSIYRLHLFWIFDDHKTSQGFNFQAIFISYLPWSFCVTLIGWFWAIEDNNYHHKKYKCTMKYINTTNYILCWFDFDTRACVFLMILIQSLTQGCWISEPRDHNYSWSEPKRYVLKYLYPTWTSGCLLRWGSCIWFDQRFW